MTPEAYAERGELIDKLLLHLITVLPMAKGYSREHPVGNNRQMVQEADELVKSVIQSRNDN